MSFLVLDHMTAMSYLPKYCVILRERRQRNFIQNCLERYDLRQLNIKADRNLVDDLGSSSRKVVIKICFRCCKELFKKRRKLLDSLHNVNSDLSFLCRPNQTTHRKDQGSIAVKKGVDCANSVENIVAEKNSIRTKSVRALVVSLKKFFITVLCSSRILFTLKMSWA